LAKFSLLLPFLLLAPDVSAGRTARALADESGVSPAGIITIITTTAAEATMLTYHPGDKH
jgi:hypothetical protein